MPDTCEKPYPDGQADPLTGPVDPYADPSQSVDIHSPLIPFHNYRQIHVGEVAWGLGVTSKSWADIPRCPKKWGDIAHYYYPCAALGYITQEIASPQLLAHIATAIPIVAVLKYLLPAVGVHLPV